MVLTNERAEMLAKYLTERKEYGYDLLEMEASDAVVKINADGFDFTVEELHAFADLMDSAVPNAENELDENSLENVSGGVLVTAAVLAAGIAIGFAAGRKSKRRW